MVVPMRTAMCSSPPQQANGPSVSIRTPPPTRRSSTSRRSTSNSPRTRSCCATVCLPARPAVRWSRRRRRCRSRFPRPTSSVISRGSAPRSIPSSPMPKPRSPGRLPGPRLRSWQQPRTVRLSSWRPRPWPSRIRRRSSGSTRVLACVSSSHSGRTCSAADRVCRVPSTRSSGAGSHRPGTPSNTSARSSSPNSTRSMPKASGSRRRSSPRLSRCRPRPISAPCPRSTRT